MLWLTGLGPECNARGPIFTSKVSLSSCFLPHAQLQLSLPPTPPSLNEAVASDDDDMDDGVTCLCVPLSFAFCMTLLRADFFWMDGVTCLCVPLSFAFCMTLLCADFFLSNSPKIALLFVALSIHSTSCYRILSSFDGALRALNIQIIIIIIIII